MEEHLSAVAAARPRESKQRDEQPTLFFASLRNQHLAASAANSRPIHTRKLETQHCINISASRLVVSNRSERASERASERDREGRLTGTKTDRDEFGDKMRKRERDKIQLLFSTSASAVMLGPGCSKVSRPAVVHKLCSATPHVH